MTALAVIQVLTACVIWIVIRHMNASNRAIGRQIARQADAHYELATQHRELAKGMRDLTGLVDATLTDDPDARGPKA